MKANIININGEKTKEIELPSCFNDEVRHDIIKRAFEAETSLLRQPYGSFLWAGMQQSASGKIRHARRKYKTACGYTLARLPRKVLSRSGGGRFYWVGATVSGTVGGREAHPPKPERVWTKNINKKEKLKAIRSAIAATSQLKELIKRYSILQGKAEDVKKLSLPIVIEDKIEDMKKTKELIAALEKILGPLKKIAFREKKIRAGQGKSRNRFYKIPSGLLIVSGKEIPAAKSLAGCGVENILAKSMHVRNFAPGGIAGRITVFTENAINEIKNNGRLK